jgi:hypothetical protein
LQEEEEDGNKIPVLTSREHLLNYESDSSDDGAGSDSSMDLAVGLRKQKEELEVGNVWGQSKKGFYGRDRKHDDESSSEEDAEDEYQEALRLQKVRAKKLS